MAQQNIGYTRLAQRTAASKVNANFTELYNLNKVVEADNQSAAGSFVVPANHVIDAIYIRNNTANAVTGGIKMGTAAGGTQVVTAQAVGANAIAVVPEANILIRAWPAQQTVYFDAVTDWNSANVDITVLLVKAF